MKIAFHNPMLCVRGSSVALYDYADYNEKLLENVSIIIIPRSSLTKNESLACVHFCTRFSVFVYDDSDPEALDRLLQQQKCDVLYTIKYGKRDSMVSQKIKTCVHCVFDMSEPHGTVYAGVSRALAKKFNSELFVPHMIALKPDPSAGSWREQLKIPENSVVFGRYGGLDTFDVPFLWPVIQRVVTANKNVHFLFINTPQIVNHPNIHFLPKIVDDKDKCKFINSCDAYIEGSSIGHTFGLALASFAVHNKPALIYNDGHLWNTAHIDIMREKGIYFATEQEFYNLLSNFSVENYKNKDYNGYAEYTPEKVMDIFKKVFLD